MDRRDFLRTGAFVFGSMAASAPVMAAFRRAIGSGNLSDASIQALSDSLNGSLILQTSTDFSSAVKVYNSRFNDMRPMAIARCADAADAATCMEWCIAHDIHFVARAGGHSYCGWSTCEGLVIDVGPLQDMEYDPSTGIATFGAGVQLVDVYHYLFRIRSRHRRGHVSFRRAHRAAAWWRPGNAHQGPRHDIGPARQCRCDPVRRFDGPLGRVQ